MSRLIIADIKTPVMNGGPTGHYFSVAQNYYEIFHNKISTLIAGGPIYATQFADEITMLPYNQEQNSKKQVSGLAKYFCNARILFSQCANDILVVQQGGDVTFFVACVLFYRKRKNKLFLIQYSTAALRSGFKRMLYNIAKHKIDGIICPTEDVGNAFNRPYCVVPDYIYTQSEANDVVIPFDRKLYDICILGRIVEEKGIVEFLEHYADSPYKMIIAGRAVNEELVAKLQAITKGHKNIILRLEYLSQTEYECYLRQSRFSVLNYQGEYSRRSSGVVLDMIYHDVPIIGLKCKAFDFICHNKLGYVYDNLKVLDLHAIITPQMHQAYIENIARYKHKQTLFINKLGDFMGV